MSKRAPEKERNSIFIIQYSYSNTNTNSNSDIMTNGGTLNPPNSLGRSLVDSEPPPTPSPPIKWGRDQFEQLRRRMIEIENKMNWTYHDLEKMKADSKRRKRTSQPPKPNWLSLRQLSGRVRRTGLSPPFSHGNQRELETWITVCRIRFAGQPSKFDTEEKKVIHR